MAIGMGLCSEALSLFSFFFLFLPRSGQHPICRRRYVQYQNRTPPIIAPPVFTIPVPCQFAACYFNLLQPPKLRTYSEVFFSPTAKPLEAGEALVYFLSASFSWGALKKPPPPPQFRPSFPKPNL